MTLFTYFATTSPIRRQLSLLVAIAVLGLALFSSVATSWRASKAGWRCSTVPRRTLAKPSPPRSPSPTWSPSR
jgi:hypothetical protein